MSSSDTPDTVHPTTSTQTSQTGSLLSEHGGLREEPEEQEEPEETGDDEEVEEALTGGLLIPGGFSRRERDSVDKAHFQESLRMPNGGDQPPEIAQVFLSSSSTAQTNPPTTSGVHRRIGGDMSTTARTMPLRQDRNAPRFEGDATLLSRYLEDIEEITEACGKVGERIRYAKYFCDPANERVFQSVEVETPGMNWAEFRRALAERYTVQEEERPTLRALEDMVWERARSGFKTRADLVDYVRDFRIRAALLMQEEIISDGEAGRWLLKALPKEVAADLTQRMQVKHADHKPSMPYKLKDLIDGLLWVSEKFAAGESGHTGLASVVKPEPVTPPVVVKQESGEMMVFADALKGLTQVMERMSQNQYGGGGRFGGVGGRGGGVSGGFNGGGPGRPGFGGGGLGRGGGPPGGFQGAGVRPQACNFCDSLDHFIRNCPRVDEYVAANRCVRGDGGRVTLPNGNFLPSWARGRTMQERFDHYHEAQSQFNKLPAGPTVSQSLYKVSMEEVGGEVRREEVQYALEKDADELRSLEVMANEVRKRMEKKRDVLEAVEIVREKPPRGPPGVKEIPAKRGKEKEGVMSGGGGVKAVPRSEVRDPGAPQFRYHSAAEDSSLVKAVLDRALSGTVEVSQRELLALAPDIRRQMKEMTTSKRVPVSGAANVMWNHEHGEVEVGNFNNVSQEHDAEVTGRYTVQEDGTVLVAEDSLPLRCVDVVVNGRTVESILDNGSQIVAMSQELWKSLQIPIRSDKIMMMEAANKTKSATMGLLENLQVTIGPVELCLQVQVMKDAPYDMLLGRPFYSLAECVTKDFSSGEQYLTMRDPNSGREITVPTRNRVRKKATGVRQDFQSSRSR